MSSISEFLANLKGGGARPNKFEVVVDFPAFAGTQEEIRKTAFLAQSSQLPGSNLGVAETAFRGRVLKLPGDRTFDEFEVTFYNDTDFALRDAFEAWHNGINQYNSNVGLLAPEDYFSTVSVYQLNGQNERIKEYTMYHAWPQIIAPIDLAQDSNDTIEIFSVTISYSDLDNGVST